MERFILNVLLILLAGGVFYCVFPKYKLINSHTKLNTITGSVERKTTAQGFGY